MSRVAMIRHRLESLRADPVLVNSSLIFLTTTLMAGAGAVFWVVAARLQPPSQVGLAGSLVSAADSLSLFAQLGLNITILQTMPTSERRAADVTTACTIVAGAGALLGLGYALLLPATSPRLTAVLHSPWTIAIFALLVAGTALNMLTDTVFLSIDRVRSYLWTNGVMLGVAKLSLPFVVVGLGAFGLYGSYGGATLLCAVVSLFVIFRHVPGPRRLSPSPQLRGARKFAGAGYVTYVLSVVPQLVVPLLVINALGAGQGAVYFISVQIVTLLNAVTLAIGNSMYAESQRAPERRRDVVRRGGITLAVCATAGTIGMVVLAPLFLSIFGDHYAENGTATLRIMSLATLAYGFNYWCALRLRIAHRLGAMIGSQTVATAGVLVLAAMAAPHGTTWVAVAWTVGLVVGGLVAFAISTFVARIEDGDPLESAL